MAGTSQREKYAVSNPCPEHATPRRRTSCHSLRLRFGDMLLILKIAFGTYNTIPITPEGIVIEPILSPDFAWVEVSLCRAKAVQRWSNNASANDDGAKIRIRNFPFLNQSQRSHKVTSDTSPRRSQVKQSHIESAIYYYFMSLCISSLSSCPRREPMLYPQSSSSSQHHSATVYPRASKQATRRQASEA